jgi:hypothetical protein
MFLLRGRSGRDRIVVGFITTYAMSITTKVVSSNPAQARCTQVLLVEKTKMSWENHMLLMHF